MSYGKPPNDMPLTHDERSASMQRAQELHDDIEAWKKRHKIAPPGIISQNVPDERPTPFESDSYNKGAVAPMDLPDGSTSIRPKRKQKPKDTSFGWVDNLGNMDLFGSILILACVVSIIVSIILSYRDSRDHFNPCDKYAQLTIKEVPAQCVSYFLED